MSGCKIRCPRNEEHAAFEWTIPLPMLLPKVRVTVDTMPVAQMPHAVIHVCSGCAWWEFLKAYGTTWSVEAVKVYLLKRMNSYRLSGALFTCREIFDCQAFEGNGLKLVR